MKKIKVYNRSFEEDYFEAQKLFWWEPFYANSKYDIEFVYKEPYNADIIYSNIFNHADQPFEAYESKKTVLVPQPIYSKDVNLKFNVISVPLLMSEQALIRDDNDFIELCRKYKRKTSFGFIGNFNERYDLTVLDYASSFDGIFTVDEPGYSRPHYYNIYDYQEVNRTILKDLELKSYYTRPADSIWGLEQKVKIRHIKKYLGELSGCKFVFCPRGTGSSSYRLYETLMIGSIPIITGMKDYPFDDEYDWDSFSIRGESLRNIDELIEKVKNLSDKDIEEMRNNGIKFYEEKCRPDVFNDWVIENYLL